MLSVLLHGNSFVVTCHAVVAFSALHGARIKSHSKQPPAQSNLACMKLQTIHNRSVERFFAFARSVCSLNIAEQVLTVYCMTGDTAATHGRLASSEHTR